MVFHFTRQSSRQSVVMLLLLLVACASSATVVHNAPQVCLTMTPCQLYHHFTKKMSLLRELKSQDESTVSPLGNKDINLKIDKNITTRLDLLEGRQNTLIHKMNGISEQDTVLKRNRKVISSVQYTLQNVEAILANLETTSEEVKGTVDGIKNKVQTLSVARDNMQAIIHHQEDIIQVLQSHSEGLDRHANITREDILNLKKKNVHFNNTIHSLKEKHEKMKTTCAKATEDIVKLSDLIRRRDTKSRQDERHLMNLRDRLHTLTQEMDVLKLNSKAIQDDRHLVQEKQVEVVLSLEDVSRRTAALEGGYKEIAEVLLEYFTRELGPEALSSFKNVKD